MDALATVLLRRAGAVGVPAPEPRQSGGPAGVNALEASLAAYGWLLSPELRDRLAALDPVARGRWTDFIAATAANLAGTDRDHTTLFRRFPDTAAGVAERYADRIIVHLLQDDTGPCLLCGATGTLHPLDPCGHPVCGRCFDPADYSACPICGRRPSGGSTYLPVVGRRSPAPAGPPLRLRRITLTDSPEALAARLRDELVARPSALSGTDLDDLRVLVAATAPDRLDWLPETVPARETLASVLGWALPGQVGPVAARWGTATDVARTLWAYSGGDPGLILPHRASHDGPGESWRPWHEPRVEVLPARVRALPRPLRRAVLAFLDGLDLPTAAEDIARHPAVWKRLAERLHPFERVAAHPSAAVAFASLRGTRAPAADPLGRAMIAAAGRHPDRLELTRHGDGRVSVRVRSFAAVVEAALAAGDVPGATALLARRPGELWRRLDHLLRRAADDDAVSRVLRAAATTAPRVAPAVLAGAAAELHHRDRTVRAGAEAIAAARAGAAARRAAIAEWRARAAGRFSSAGVSSGSSGSGSSGSPGSSVSSGTAGAGSGRSVMARFTDAWFGSRQAAEAVRPEPEGVGRAQPEEVGRAQPGEAGRAQPEQARRGPGVPYRGPAPGGPRRTFFPRGDVVRTWTEPELRDPIPAGAVAAIRSLVDTELSGRAARQSRFDVAVLDASLARVPAPGRERAGSEQLAGWPRGSVRTVADAAVLRLFLHWVELPGREGRVDLDLSCSFYTSSWEDAGHCDYTNLRYRDRAARHSGDFTSAPAPQGATEFLDLDRAKLHAADVTWAVPVVLSYNDVPFDALPEAFAGLSLPAKGSGGLDPARVLQRFGLRGNAKSMIPMVLHVPSGTLMWLDASLSTRGYGHSVGTYGPGLGRVAADLWEHFSTDNRPTLLDLVSWHAASRATEILVRHPDGTVTPIPASPDPATRIAAIRTAAHSDKSGIPLALPPDTRLLAALPDAATLATLTGTTPPPAAGSVAVLAEHGTTAAPWSVISAADLSAGLIPTP